MIDSRSWVVVDSASSASKAFLYRTIRTPDSAASLKQYFTSSSAIAITIEKYYFSSVLAVLSARRLKKRVAKSRGKTLTRIEIILEMNLRVYWTQDLRRNSTRPRCEQFLTTTRYRLSGMLSLLRKSIIFCDTIMSVNMLMIELARLEKLMSLTPSGKDVSRKSLATVPSFPFPLQTFSMSAKLLFKYLTNVWQTCLTFCCRSEQLLIQSPGSGSSKMDWNSSHPCISCFIVITYIFIYIILINISMQFKIQQTYPAPPQGVSAFNTLTYLPSRHSLLLYGLQKSAVEPQPEQPKKKISFKASKQPAPPSLDKISMYSLEERKWQIIEAKGKIPTPREDFSAFEIANCLVIFGGRANTKYLNQVVALNIETNLWKKLFSLEGPPPAKDPLIIKTSPTTACLFSAGNLWILELSDVKWELSANELPGSVWEKLEIKFPEDILFLWQINKEEILLVASEKTFVISLKQKSKLRQISFQARKMMNFGSKFKTAHLIEEKGGHYASRIVIGTENSIQVLEYQNEGSEKIQILTVAEANDKEEDHIKIQRGIHCLIASDSDCLFFIDPKGELLSLHFEFAQQDTTRLVPANNIGSQGQMAGGRIGNFDFQNCIEEEQQLDESSSYFMHNSNSQVRLTANRGHEQDDDIEDEMEDRKFLMKSHDSPISRKQRQERKGGNHYAHPYQISGNRAQLGQEDNSESDLKIEYQDTESQNSVLLKSKLATILTHQHLKRRLLEQKVDTLEQGIKKSEKFVLLLCRHSEEREKMRHIERVKDLRQQLEGSWGKEHYFRKEMENDRIPNKIRHVVEKVLADAKKDSESDNTDQ